MLVGYDVYEAAWDDDDFTDRFPFSVLLHITVLLSEGFDFLFGSIFCHGDLTA